MSTSSNSLPGASPEDVSPPPSSLPGDSSFSGIVANESYNFSFGNPRLGFTSGTMHLYRHNADSTASSDLPVGRKSMLCVLGVPNQLTCGDFVQFCGCFTEHILEMRIVRIDAIEDKYSILIKFGSQENADHFYKNLDGRSFSLVEEEACHVLFTVDVQYTHSIEHAQASAGSSAELASCPVCHDTLDQGMNGIITSICNHSFHISCISKEFTDSSCPICRYRERQPEKSLCSVCQTSYNLWVCVICGHVGCWSGSGRYKEGHATKHWEKTDHRYSIELETQRVWDYVGKNYVDLLIQSKADEQFVDCSHANHSRGSCEALLNSKVEAILNEYKELLTTLLEKQKLYFMPLLQDANEQTDRAFNQAVEQGMSSKLVDKLAKLVEQKRFLDDLNDSRYEDQEILEAKIVEVEERVRKALQLKDDEIHAKEEELNNLMSLLSAEQPSVSDETKDATSIEPGESSSSGR